MADLAPVLQGLAVPERQVLAWLQPTRAEVFTPERFPVFNLDVEEGRYYGFPVVDVPGFKFGRYHHREEQMPAEAMRREVDAEDEALLRQFAARYFPEGNGPTMALRACMFTNTPDEHFILDLHPAHPQVVLASPCSGHGYKLGDRRSARGFGDRGAVVSARYRFFGDAPFRSRAGRLMASASQRRRAGRD